MSLHAGSFIQQRETVGLNSLNGDLDQPPLYAMPRIIECAIMGSPRQKLTLSELRVTLKRRFRYYEKEEARGVRSWEVSGLYFKDNRSFLHLSIREPFFRICRRRSGSWMRNALNLVKGVTGQSINLHRLWIVLQNEFLVQGYHQGKILLKEENQRAR